MCVVGISVAEMKIVYIPLGKVLFYFLFKIMLLGDIHNACLKTVFQIISVDYFRK